MMVEQKKKKMRPMRLNLIESHKVDLEKELSPVANEKKEEEMTVPENAFE